MKLFIDCSNRYWRRVALFDGNNQELAKVEGEEELVYLIDTLVKEQKINLEEIREVEAKMEGESRVGVLIGVSGANALNYCLGLKKVEELEYPPEPKVGL